MSSSSILLGYHDTPAAPAPVGFASNTPPITEPEGGPIWYDGDAPLLTVAPTGAGKGISAIIPTALTNPSPMVIIDPKGEAYGVTAAQRRRMGHKVILLDPFRCCEDGVSDGLNPMDLIDLQSDTAVDDALSLATAMMPIMQRTDPFWDFRARQVALGLILWVCAYAPAEYRHLGTVRRALTSGYDKLGGIVAAMQKSTLLDGRIADSTSILTTAADKTRDSIMVTAQQHVDFLGSQRVMDALGRSSLPLSDIRDGKPVTVYMILPPERLESHAPLLRLWLSMIITVISRRKVIPPLRTLLVIDEAAQLGELPALKTAVTLMRGYGLTTWTFWQSFSQLQMTYPQDWKTMIDNAAVVQAFGFYSKAFADEVFALTGYGGRETFTDLQGDRQIVSRPGIGPETCRKVNYLTDPRHAGLWEHNRLFANRRREPVDNRRRKKIKARERA